MPLEPIQLDDLTWSDLTTAARDRIAGVSHGEWTFHAPVDPGITLLELFATQLEQRLFWMDQPSDERTAAMLSLLGIKPKPARVAGTVLCLGISKNNEASKEVTGIVTADTIMELDAQRSTVRFRTTQTTRLLPVKWLAGPADTNSRRSRARKHLPARCEPSLRLQVGREDRTQDLTGARIPCLLSADGGPTRIAIELDGDSLEEKSSRHDDFVSLLFDLDTPKHISPQWITHHDLEDGHQRESQSTSESREDPSDFDNGCHKALNPAPLSWSFAFSQSDDPFTTTEFHAFTKVEDGTRGFRRSGVVRFSAHDLTSKAKWFVIVVQSSPCSYSVLPRVRQIIPNCVLAEHRLKYQFCDATDDELTSQVESWESRRLPGNTLRLDFGTQEPLLVDSVRLSLRERTSGSKDETELQAWRPARDFSRFGPEDRVFVASRDRRRLFFGDGLNGRLPIPKRMGGTDGPELFHLDFDVGGGEAGNLRSGQRWASCTALRAVNVVSAEGGEEAETLEDAAMQARTELRRVRRSVTRSDIERLARETPAAGIARAHAAVGLHPNHPCVPVPGAVTVYVVPGLPPSLRRFHERSCGDDLVALKPDTSTIASVARWLNAARLVTQEICVCPPNYEVVDLSVWLSGAPIDPDSTRETVTVALQEYLHPLFGGPDRNGWPFGGSLRPSELVQVVADAVESELTVERVGIRKRGMTEIERKTPATPTPNDCPTDSNSPQFEACKDVEVTPHGLIALQTVRLEFVSTHARTRGLL